MAKKGKKRVYLEFCELKDAGFEEMQFTEEELKAMQLAGDEMLKDSEEFFKNLKEFNGSEGN